LETMKKHQPNLVYLAFNQTDDFAHRGDYSAYLKSAYTTDVFLKDLWEFTQSDPFYKDQTSFIIATDHGRGTQPVENWKHHGAKIDGADQVWLIAFGNQVTVKGEAAQNEQLYNNQVAPTILKWFGLENLGKELPGDPINCSLAE